MITLVRYVPETNRTRYYNMSFQYDFLAGVTLMREWGSVGQAGRVMTAAYPNEQAAFPVILEVLERKKKRGYEVKEISSHLAVMLSNLEEARDKQTCQLKVICIHLAAMLQKLEEAEKPRRKKASSLKKSQHLSEKINHHQTRKGKDHDRHHEQDHDNRIRRTRPDNQESRRKRSS